MEKSLKINLIKIVISGILFGASFLLPVEGYWRMGAFLVPYLIIGAEVLGKAVRNLFRGQIFDECFLMSIATVGAWILGDYPEAVAVMLFYQTGEFFQDFSVGRSKRSIAELMNVRPDYANVIREGQEERVDPECVQVGETILVKPGEKIPLDGRVLEGVSSVNTSALTGESLPQDVEAGSTVISGCINLSGVLTIETTKVFGETTVAKILDMVENSASQKARSEAFITRFAKVYTPIVTISAVLLAFLPPLLLHTGFAVWIKRALMFLVVSCPCALVISVPLSFFGGIGGASKKGILVKGSNHLEDLAKVQTLVFDKTGTLTEGSFEVTAIIPSDRNMYHEKELLRFAAYVERYSTHPIAESILRAYGNLQEGVVSQCREIAGKGVEGIVDGRTVCAGNKKYMEEIGLSCPKPRQAGTYVYLSVDGSYAGCIVIADCVKQDAEKAVAGLKTLGVLRIVMLTGDSQETAEAVGQALGIQEIYSGLLPGDKVEKVRELSASKVAGSKIAFVGDGINDAPVLTGVDVGIAMGALGSDAAIEAADIVLMDDMPSKIGMAVKIARKTLRIVRQNIVFALAVKGVILLLSAIGIGNMWLAVFADVGVSFIAIINAMRAMRIA